MTKEEIEKLKDITPGQVIAETIRTHIQFIEKKEGKDGVKKLLDKLTELGYPIDLSKLKTFQYVPTWLADLVILLAKELFSWRDSDIFEMGNLAPKYSFIMILFVKFFISPKTVAKMAPEMWKKHFTDGFLESEYNEKEKYFRVRLHHNCHPTLCIFYAGYFQRIAEYVVKAKNFKTEETKCMSKGDPYHEFVIKWE
jgi:hypothetical protein